MTALDRSDNGQPCMCGTPFTCMADEHDRAVWKTGHYYDPTTLLCACGALDHSEWGCSA